MAAAGYAGIDLGPVGYLGDGERLAELLAERGLGLAGGYVELPYLRPGRARGRVAELDEMLDVFDACVAPPGPPPKPTLADTGIAGGRMLPARSVRDQSLGYDDDGWGRFAAGLATVLARCRDRGYEPTFHPETGTYVEAQWEIERVLEVSDVGLCLETGHMLLGGGDPVAICADWATGSTSCTSRTRGWSVMERIVAEGAPVTGDLDPGGVLRAGSRRHRPDAVLDGLRRSLRRLARGRAGHPAPQRRTDARPPAEQRHNRAFLARTGL